MQHLICRSERKLLSITQPATKTILETRKETDHYCRMLRLVIAVCKHRVGGREGGGGDMYWGDCQVHLVDGHCSRTGVKTTVLSPGYLPREFSLRGYVMLQGVILSSGTLLICLESVRCGLGHAGMIKLTPPVMLSDEI